MNIDTQISTTFNSRNIEIRKADKIMRQAMNYCPAISTSKVKYYEVVKKNSYNSRKCLHLFEELSSLRIARIKLPLKQQIDRIISDTKKTHNGNCLEQVYIALAAFLANGYKDLRFGNLNLKTTTITPFNSLYQKDSSLDHVVLIVNAGKNANFHNINTFDKHSMVVDPWCGFVDYVSNAIREYEAFFIKGDRDQMEYGNKIKRRITFAPRDSFRHRRQSLVNFDVKYPEFIVE